MKMHKAGDDTCSNRCACTSEMDCHHYCDCQEGVDTYAIPRGVMPNVREMHFLDADGNVHTVTFSGKSNHP